MKKGILDYKAWGVYALLPLEMQKKIKDKTALGSHGNYTKVMQEADSYHLFNFVFQRGNYYKFFKTSHKARSEIDRNHKYGNFCYLEKVQKKDLSAAIEELRAKAGC